MSALWPLLTIVRRHLFVNVFYLFQHLSVSLVLLPAASLLRKHTVMQWCCRISPTLIRSSHTWTLSSHLHLCVVSLFSYHILSFRATGWMSRGAPSLPHSRYEYKIEVVIVSPRLHRISLCSSLIILLHISAVKILLSGLTVSFTPREGIWILFPGNRSVWKSCNILTSAWHFWMSEWMIEWMLFILVLKWNHAFTKTSNKQQQPKKGIGRIPRLIFANPIHFINRNTDLL